MGAPDNSSSKRSLNDLNISQQTSSRSFSHNSEDVQSQIDILARLRIIEQLQRFSLPRFRSSTPDDLVTDILNWLTLCFCPNAASDDVAVALGLFKGQITVYVANTPNTPTTSALNLAKNVLKTAFKQVLSDSSISTIGAARLFVRMIVDIGHLRIQRKITLLGTTDGDPNQTGFRFVSLVNSWLFYRPGGECSKGFVNKAMAYTGGNVANTTEYMIQSFWMIVEQAKFSADDMTPDERFNYLTSIMTACDLFVKSTFFKDLLNHHTFRMTLKEQDRIFLHTLLRRLSHIASYKTGAAKIAFIGLPFIRDILGDSGIKAFLEDNDKGEGIVFELISEHLESLRHPFHPLVPSRSTRTFTWQEPPMELLSSILGISGHQKSFFGGSAEGDECNHSRGGSNTSTSSTNTSSTESTGSLSFGAHSYGDLDRLDAQFQLDLISSDMVSDAWVPGDTVTATYHSVLQLINHLEILDVDIMGQTLGTSKPICWMCVNYIKALENVQVAKAGECELEERARQAAFEKPPKLSEDEIEEMIPKRWLTSKGSGKVRHDWLLPPSTPLEIVDTVVEQAHRELERVIGEVAFDCYY